MSDEVRDLLVRGVAAAKAGERDEARFYLEWVLRMRPNSSQRIKTWYTLSKISIDEREKRKYLEAILAAEPTYALARRELAVLDGKLEVKQIIDPDRLSNTVYSPEQAKVQRFVCPNCGGRLIYLPDGLSLACEQCMQTAVSDVGTEEKSQSPRDFTVAMATAKGHIHPELERSFACLACGADFSVKKDSLTAGCPFCDAVYVIEHEESSKIFGFEALIPFGISNERALDLLLERLAKISRRDLSLRGFYLPVWAFTLTLPRKVEKKFTSSGARPVLVSASKTLPERWKRALYQFDLSALKPFKPAYLADWPAETYQVSLSDASLDARWQMLAFIRSEGLEMQITSMDLEIEDFRLILLPLWWAEFFWEGKRYVILVNGQNGTINLDSPKKGRPNWLMKFLELDD